MPAMLNLRDKRSILNGTGKQRWNDLEYCRVDVAAGVQRRNKRY